MWKIIVCLSLLTSLTAAGGQVDELPKIRNPYQMMDYLMKNITEKVDDPYEYGEIAEILMEELRTFRFKPFMKLLCHNPTKCLTFAKKFTKPLPKDVEKAFQNYIAVSKINDNLNDTCTQTSVDLLEELRGKTLVIKDHKEYGSHELDNWGQVDHYISLIMIVHGIKCQPIYEQRFNSRLEEDRDKVMQAVDLGHKFLETKEFEKLDELLSLESGMNSVMEQLLSSELDKVIAEVSQRIHNSAINRRQDPKKLMYEPCKSVEKNVGPNLFDLVDYDFRYSTKLARYEMRVESLPYKYAWIGYKMCKLFIENSLQIKDE